MDLESLEDWLAAELAERLLAVAMEPRWGEKLVVLLEYGSVARSESSSDHELATGLEELLVAAMEQSLGKESVVLLDEVLVAKLEQV